MPIYEFNCTEGHNFEALLDEKKKDITLKCPECKAESKRKEISSFSISVRGDSVNNSIDVVVGRDADERRSYYANRENKKNKLKSRNPEREKIFKTGEESYTVVNKDGTKDSID